jgi:peptidyl-prolyl cis-trans isomerase SurA
MAPMIACNWPRRQTFKVNLAKLICICFVAAAATTFMALPLARAQAIVATVNGDPITDIDVEQRIKLLHVLRQPATRDAAMESLIDDQLETEETAKFKITVGDAEIGQQVGRVASEMKTTPEALWTALQNAGVSESHFKDHFAANFKFNLLVQAYNKGVEASETQVRAELAKDGGKAAAGVDYKLHQIIFTVLASDTPAVGEAQFKAAEQLRTRFTDCDSGLTLARNMEDVAVKEEVIRNSNEISEGLKDLLDKTPVGHLTPPERSGEGIAMIALCGKGVSNDDTAVRQAISQRLLAAEIEADAERRLKQLRSYAVVEKK